MHLHLQEGGVKNIRPTLWSFPLLQRLHLNQIERENGPQVARGRGQGAQTSMQVLPTEEAGVPLSHTGPMQTLPTLVRTPF